MTREDAVKNLLSRNVEEVIEEGHLRAAMNGTKKLRVKHGIDPTGPKIHIGRAVVLWKLREFQDLGHKIVLVIGDFTAQIGDPSDKLEKRPFLSHEQVRKNLKGYLDQVGLILDMKKVEVRYNSEWLKKLDFQQISQLAETFSVRQMIERKNFKGRWENHEEISLREFLYPLMQGYDSVAIKADLELGGTDQLFNMLAGRRIQEYYGQKPQDVMTTKMVIGLDGRKMSTSWGNVVNVSDAPDEQFGRLMSLNDDLIAEYFETVTGAAMSDVAAVRKALSAGRNPRDLKIELASSVVERYHGAAAASSAREKFEKLFSKKEVPADVPELKLKKGAMTALDLVVAAGAKSKSEGRRLIEQGAFDFNGKTEKDPGATLVLKGGELIKLGKHRFFKVR
ncbi:MAG TPA: tyrosine--tRNA ligase [Candidatus Paceibacterota bacterium]|nr:tyrosine--tRNA ligase [Candidatus Paceibacterota bacterium]